MCEGNRKYSIQFKKKYIRKINVNGSKNLQLKKNICPNIFFVQVSFKIIMCMDVFLIVIFRVCSKTILHRKNIVVYQNHRSQSLTF